MSPDALALAARHDPEAAEALLKAVPSLPKKAARHSPLPYDEAYGVALVGFWEAVLSFNPTKGMRFTSWAMEKMIRALQEEARQTGLIHLPRPLRERLSGKRPPFPREEDALHDKWLWAIGCDVLSLDTLYTDHEDGEAEARLPADPSPGPDERADRLLCIRRWQDALPDRWWQVLWRMDALGETALSVAREWGISESRVCEIRQQARAAILRMEADHANR